MTDQADNLRHYVEGKKAAAKTIAVISGKGGVGKSNTALNFAIELQKRSKKVLLFDLDIGMGNIDILLGNDSTYTIVDLFTDYRPIHDMIESGPKDLHYIAGGTSLNELVEMDEKKMSHFFRQYDLLVKEYDYVLFDMGAGITTSSLSFILAADECIVVTTPEPPSLTDAYSMLKQIILKKINIPIYLIVNRCPNIKLGHKTIERFTEVVKRFLNKDIVALGNLPNDKVVPTAVFRQIPYVLFNKNAPVSRAMDQVVTAFLHTKRDDETPQSFIQKLKRLLT